MLSWYNVHKKGVLMTYRQWKFTQFYSTNGGNATKAAREAGYSLNGVNRMGYYLKKRLRFEIAYWNGKQDERAKLVNQMLGEERRQAREHRRQRQAKKEVAYATERAGRDITD
ncbi:MAG: hypothetical protein FWG36_09320 [Oscillospiraceae bacterium]|nr:hypothetical protein [Oscillospiraceae bacterium]